MPLSTARILVLVWFTLLAIPLAIAESARPNILLIVADDLGSSDIGAYGSEIDAANLDALAQQGFLLTQFHAAPNCAPSRSAMLTGVDTSRPGLGGNHGAVRKTKKASPPTRGISARMWSWCPSLLRNDGYHTAMAGKWHLGEEPRGPSREAGVSMRPLFALLNGAASN